MAATDNERECESCHSLCMCRMRNKANGSTRDSALLLCAGSAVVRATGLDFRFCTHSNTKRVECEESVVCCKSDTGKQNQRD